MKNKCVFLCVCKYTYIFEYVCFEFWDETNETSLQHLTLRHCPKKSALFPDLAKCIQKSVGCEYYVRENSLLKRAYILLFYMVAKLQGCHGLINNLLRKRSLFPNFLMDENEQGNVTPLPIIITNSLSRKLSGAFSTKQKYLRKRSLSRPSIPIFTTLYILYSLIIMNHGPLRVRKKTKN